MVDRGCGVYRGRNWWQSAHGSEHVPQFDYLFHEWCCSVCGESIDFDRFTGGEGDGSTKSNERPVF